jgi:hypothetical protein
MGTGRADQLAKLAREQARDRFGEGKPWPADRRSKRESDLAGPEGEAFELDRLPDPRAEEPSRRADGIEATAALKPRMLDGERRPAFLLGAAVPWGPEVTRYDPAAGQPCPVCGGRPGRRAVCLCCSASGDHPLAFPMQPRARKARRGELAGGLGRRRR